jgi:secreted trypsin-like serine protease
MKVFVVFLSFCTFATLCFHAEMDKRINRIVGGEKTPFHYAYEISLQRYSPSYGFFASKNFTHFCGASIVGENHLVTAAHCVDGKNMSQFFALAGTSSLKDASSGSRHPIQSCLVHEKYVRLTSNTTSQNDIALCKVQFPFVFGDKIAKISLDKTYTPADVNATLTGWGSVRKFRWLPFPFYDEIAYPNDLQRGFLPTISNEKCKEKNPKIENNHICTFGGDGKGACSG